MALFVVLVSVYKTQLLLVPLSPEIQCHVAVFAGQNGLDVGKADSINNSGGSLGEHPEMEDERTAIPPYLLKMPTPQVSCRPLYRLLNL